MLRRIEVEAVEMAVGILPPDALHELDDDDSVGRLELGQLESVWSCRSLAAAQSPHSSSFPASIDEVKLTSSG